MQKLIFLNNKSGELTILLTVQEMLLLWDKHYK